MSTTTLVTAEELLRKKDDTYRTELVRGVLRQKPYLHFEQGNISCNIGNALANCSKVFADAVVMGVGFITATNPDTVLAPSVAFISAKRLGPQGLPDGYISGAPDLAVEMVSPGDTVYEVEEKVEEWLAAGAQAVWIVNPKKKTVTVYRAGSDEQILRENEMLSGDDVVPGFALRVGDVFI